MGFNPCRKLGASNTNAITTYRATVEFIARIVEELGIMPNCDLLRRHGVFAPEEIAMPGKVLEGLLQTLGLVDRKDPMTELVAKKLVDLANTGIRDPDHLKALTVQAFTQQQRTS